MLSEEFIEKHLDILNFDNICINQKLSSDFIEKYKDKINWIKFSYNPHLTIEIIKKYIDRFYYDILYTQHKKLLMKLISKIRKDKDD